MDNIIRTELTRHVYIDASTENDNSQPAFKSLGRLIPSSEFWYWAARMGEESLMGI